MTFKKESNLKCVLCGTTMEKFDLGDGWFKEVCPFHANVRSVIQGLHNNKPRIQNRVIHLTFNQHCQFAFFKIL